MHRLVIPAALLGVVLLISCQTTTGRTAGTPADDGRTTAAVKSKLAADRSANLTPVGVDTVDEVTDLTGVVDTAEQRLRVEQFAWDVSGVRQVVNDIQVRPSPVTVVPSAPAAPSARRRTIVGTLSSVEIARGQVDHLTLEASPRAAR